MAPREPEGGLAEIGRRGTVFDSEEPVGERSPPSAKAICSKPASRSGADSVPVPHSWPDGFSHLSSRERSPSSRLDSAKRCCVSSRVARQDAGRS
jgi:hypothetical protein